MAVKNIRNIHGASVSIRSLVKRYGGSGEPAVKGVSLEIGSGKFVTLLGPSGSGKTTTVDFHRDVTRLVA